ncbi:MAG: hypothetical protein U5N86_04600 [Planctomycetota bacterium]|nr:hypothetical protein [Planctomycetota bacterium]
MGTVPFTFGELVPKSGASIEETGTDDGVRYVSFPYMDGRLRVETGFRSRTWRARILLSAPTVAALAESRATVRELAGSEDVLTVGGESFEPVAMRADSLYFGPLNTHKNGYLQECEMVFEQVRPQ